MSCPGGQFCFSTAWGRPWSSKPAKVTLKVVMEWMDPSGDYIGGLATTGQCRRPATSDASLPRYRTCAVLSLHEDSRSMLFAPPSNGRPRRAVAGLRSMAISCAVCSVQRAGVCVHDRHRCLSRVRTDELQQSGVDTSLQRLPTGLPPPPPPPKRPPPTPPSPPGFDCRRPTSSRRSPRPVPVPVLVCCMLRCGSYCCSPCHPLALVPRGGAIRRQNVVA